MEESTDGERHAFGAHSPLRLAITGFGPFGTHRWNPSADVARAMAGHLGAWAAPGLLTLSVHALDVDFETAERFVQDILAEEASGTGPRSLVLLHLGIAASRMEVCFERLAHNRRGMRADEALAGGRVPEGRLCGDGERVRATALDVERWLRAYEAHGPVRRGGEEDWSGLPAGRVSEDCGDYVCNATYYHSLRSLEGAGLDARALFIHIPLIAPEGVAPLGALLARVALEALEALELPPSHARQTHTPPPTETPIGS